MNIFLLSINSMSSSASRRLLSRAFLIWVLLSAVAFAGLFTVPEEPLKRLGRLSLRELHILLCALAFLLYKTEIRKETRYVFVNFSIFFFYSGISFPVCSMLQRWIEWGDEWVAFFVHEYSFILYFALLMFSVVYLVIDSALIQSRVLHKYFLAASVTVLTSLYLFSPYIGDRKYLYSTSDIQDYRAIRSAMEELNNTGVSSPTTKEIISVVHLASGEELTPSHEVTQTSKEARVAAILPYMKGDDFQVLLYRPLWWDCFGVVLVCMCFIVFSVVHQFVTDPPSGAYFEKIVWCILLYCGFEALHLYAYARVISWQMYGLLEPLGWYASMIIMFMILFLFMVRLRFIQSVEGRYYENRLMTDPTRITRWRDAFDNWILRQFMNPNEVKQRFVTQSKEDTTKDITGDGL